MSDSRSRHSLLTYAGFEAKADLVRVPMMSFASCMVQLDSALAGRYMLCCHKAALAVTWPRTTFTLHAAIKRYAMSVSAYSIVLETQKASRYLSRSSDPCGKVRS